jgi:pyridoxamine 5'-phosphate oxidase
MNMAKSVLRDPFHQFSSWYNDILKSGISEPDAMFLATAGKSNQPSGRVVLLKGFDERGFIFFTNFSSRKGREIADNPKVALTFFWKEAKKQVRITGKAFKVTKLEADDYFNSRPLESRISAWISPQSSVIRDREFLEKRWKQLFSESKSAKTKRPPFWGGYRVKPTVVEFWQEREHRLHDRIQYSRVRGKWVIERLAP